MSKYLRILFTILLVGITSTVDAQLYVTDDNFADSVKVYEIILSNDGETEMLGNEALKLPMGKEVEVERLLKGQSSDGVVKIDGKEYGIDSWKLLFSDKNPEGVKDIFGDTRGRTNHTRTGKFFASMVPYYMIAILFIIGGIFVWLGFKNDKFRKIALIAVPSSLLAGSIMEIWAYSVLGTSAFWWCSPDKYGFFGALLRVIPFMAFVAFQLFSIKFYMHLLSDDEDNDLSIKPMLISMGICVPLAVVATFILVGVFHIKSPWQEIVFIGTFLISLGIGMWISFKRNIQELGKKEGIAFSLFGIAWSIGAIVAIVGLVIVIFKLIIQILMIIAIFIGAAFVLGKDGGGGDQKPVFYDKEGKTHFYAGARDEANRKIDKKREDQS